MSTVGPIVVIVLYLFLFLLLFRLVMDYVFMFARSYRPKGVMVVVLEATYSVTDPPLKALRRIIPPLKIGGMSLDLGFLVLFIGIQILIAVFSRL